jgi:hypothetical protein
MHPVIDYGTVFIYSNHSDRHDSVDMSLTLPFRRQNTLVGRRILHQYLRIGKLGLQPLRERSYSLVFQATIDE